MEPLPTITVADEITIISDSWFMTMAQRKQELRRRLGSNAQFIAVFGSSMTEPGSRDWIRAFEAGAALARAGAVTMSGGYKGIMEAASAGAASVGGTVVGITCRNLPEKSANPYVTDDWSTERWDQRLIALVWLADGYILCPGSSGTLVELSMVLETQARGFLPIRHVVGLGPFWKSVVQRIVDSDRLISFASTPRKAAQLVLGLPPAKAVRRTRNQLKG